MPFLVKIWFTVFTIAFAAMAFGIACYELIKWAMPRLAGWHDRLMSYGMWLEQHRWVHVILVAGIIATPACVIWVSSPEDDTDAANDTPNANPEP